MRTLVTGGTGFTGSFVVPMLLERGHEVRCFVRVSSDRSSLPPDGIEFAVGDLCLPESFRRAVENVDVLVNVASLGFGHAASIVDAAVGAGVGRCVFISTTAVFTSLSAESRTVRLAAEEEIRGSSLAYTILRPTMIYGGPRDRNMCRLIRLLSLFGVVPVAGRGEGLQQPVWVEDVASAIVACLEHPETIRRTYNIPGREALTFNEVIDTIGECLGKSIVKVHLPWRPIVKALRVMELWGMGLPLKAEQVLRLDEDKAFGYEEAARDFGYAPRSFRCGVAAEVAQMAEADR